MDDLAQEAELHEHVVEDVAAIRERRVRDESSLDKAG